MKRKEYMDLIDNEFYNICDDIRGLHEMINVLDSVSKFIEFSITTTQKIYDDRDIDFTVFIELNEYMDGKVKYVLSLVK